MVRNTRSKTIKSPTVFQKPNRDKTAMGSRMRSAEVKMRKPIAAPILALAYLLLGITTVTCPQKWYQPLS